MIATEVDALDRDFGKFNHETRTTFHIPAQCENLQYCSRIAPEARYFRLPAAIPNKALRFDIPEKARFKNSLEMS